MKPPNPRRAGVCTAVVAGAMMLGITPAAAAPGDGSAFGATVDVNFVERNAIHLGPFAKASTEGPTHDEAASTTVPGVLSTGLIITDAGRNEQTGAVHSGATVSDLSMKLFEPAIGTVTADSLRVSCSATQESISGTSTFAGLDLGQLSATIGPTPAPNTTIAIRYQGERAATITFNEQIRNEDGSLTVNAMHIQLYDQRIGELGSADIVLASATCGPAGLPIPLASGAGLWIGLGLLGAVAVPVGLRLRRRAHSGTTG